jgi:hypothetical protein
MRALGLFGSLAIGCLVTLGASCGDDDDNKGDGGTGGGGGTAATGGTSGGGGAATGGTGGSSGGAAMFACDYSNFGGGGHLCWSWDASGVPSPAPVIAAQQMACTQGGGTAVTACPTSGAVGKCTFSTNSSGSTVSQTIYYYAPFDRTTAMQFCMTNNAGGTTATWTPL